MISKVSRQIMEEEEEIAGFLVALKTLGLEEAEIERQFRAYLWRIHLFETSYEKSFEHTKRSNSST